MFKSEDFSLTVLAGCLGYFFLPANFFLLPFYIEEARGMVAHLSGFIILAFSAENFHRPSIAFMALFTLSSIFHSSARPLSTKALSIDRSPWSFIASK
jgi:hypothetical protein